MGQLDPSLKGGHGDFLETSAMMVVEPESVHLELCQPMNAHDPSENAKAAYIQAVDFQGGMVRLPRDTRENAPSGWFGPGDPKHSSQKIGQRAIKLSVSYIRDFVEEFRRFPLGPRK